MAQRRSNPGYVFFNPDNGLWAGSITGFGRYEIYHRDTWPEIYQLIDNLVRNQA
jgi:hypothetical protein